MMQLVDGNLDAPYLHFVFGCAPGHGIADSLVHGPQMQVHVQRARVPNLFLLPAGTRCLDGFILQRQRRFDGLVQCARRSFDRVIFDSRCINEAPDSLIMAAGIRDVLYVAQAGLRRKSVLMRGAETLLRFRTQVGIVINNPSSAEHDPSNFFQYALRRQEAGTVISNAGWWSSTQSAADEQAPEPVLALAETGWTFKVLENPASPENKDQRADGMGAAGSVGRGDV